MSISPDTIELAVAAIVGALGKFGYDKGRSLITNGKSGYLTRDSHDRECLLKIKPLIDGLERIDRHFGIVDGKLDYLNQVTTSAASAAATAASACAAVTADILKGK